MILQTRRAIRGSLSFLLICAMSFSHAQVLEEVTVTAQKREESLQEVGIAVTAFTGDQLKALGFTDTIQVANMSPGVFISGSSAGQNAQFSVRGVTQNDFLDAIEGPTAVYIDEGYVAQQNAGTQALFDVGRAEILKGPQGTLFGRNATGGLVHFITNKPTDEFEGYADLTYGRFDQVNVQAAVSGPLSDSVRGRASVYYNRHDEIIDNLYPQGAVGGPIPGGGQDHWNDDTIAGRVQLDIDLSNNVNLYLMGHASRADLGEAPYQSEPTIAVFDGAGRITNVLVAGPNETRAAIGPGGVDAGLDTNGDGIPETFGRPAGGDLFGYRDPDGDDFTLSKDFAFDDNIFTELWGVNGKLTWEMDNGMTLTAISDYKKYDRNITVDVDSAPVDQVTFNTQTDNSSFTQELRLNGEWDRGKWVVGGYFLTIDADVVNGFLISPNSILAAAGLGGTSAPNIISLETDSYSAFGQVDFDINDQLTLTGGLRVIQEEKDYSLFSGLYLSTDVQVHDTDVLLAQFPTSTADPLDGSPFTESTSDTLWSAKLGLNYQANDDLLLYATFNRGVKAGAFNAPLPLTGPPLAASDVGYDEEILLAYEIGFKSTIWDGKARLNGSAFYYDYTDYQAFSFVGVSGVVSNRDATNYGIEVDIVANPFEGFEIMTGISYIDFEVEDVSVSPGLVRDVDPSFAPQWQWAGLARYEFPAFNGNLAIQMDANYRSSFYHNINNFDANQYPGDVEANARLTYVPASEKWQASFFVNNIADARIRTIGFDLATFCGCNENAYVKPRWWGLNFRYNFF